MINRIDLHQSDVEHLLIKCYCRVPCVGPGVFPATSHVASQAARQARANHPAPNAWPWHNSSSSGGGGVTTKGQQHSAPPIPPLTAIYHYTTTLSANARDPPPPHPIRD